MSSNRIIIAASVAILLSLLLLFSSYRWQMVASCHRRGGVWDGEDSRCRMIPRVILKRDLERT